MSWMLDTNIAIEIIRGRSAHVLAALTAHTVGEVFISSISAAELWYGAAKSQQPERNAAALTKFLLPLVVLPFDTQAAVVYGRIRADLARQGAVIGPLDLLIAAQALGEKMTLVTNNTAEFSRITGLTLEDWTAP